MFLNIKNISDILPLIKGKEEIGINERGDLIVLDYKHVSNDTFDNMGAIECRGIAFDKRTGNIVHRPLHKFFNLGEKPHVMPNAIMSLGNDISVFEKLDGSMIGISLHGENIIVKTRASEFSDQAIFVKDWLATNGFLAKFKKFLNLYSGVTCVFEYTSPDNMIVIQYEEVELTLLALRDNYTGEYYSRNHRIYKDFVDIIGLPIVIEIGYNLQDLIDTVKTDVDREGYVAISNGVWFKVKNDWYCNLHRCISMLRKRDIVESIIDGRVDDLIANMMLNNINVDVIWDIISEFENEINTIAYVIDTHYRYFKDNNMSIKDFAITNKYNPYFGLIMGKIRDKEINLYDWYRRNKLKSVSLESVNLTYNKE